MDLQPYVYLYVTAILLFRSIFVHLKSISSLCSLHSVKNDSNQGSGWFKNPPHPHPFTLPHAGGENSQQSSWKLNNQLCDARWGKGVWIRSPVAPQIAAAISGPNGFTWWPFAHTALRVWEGVHSMERRLADFSILEPANNSVSPTYGIARMRGDTDESNETPSQSGADIHCSGCGLGGRSLGRPQRLAAGIRRRGGPCHGLKKQQSRSGHLRNDWKRTKLRRQNKERIIKSTQWLAHTLKVRDFVDETYTKLVTRAATFKRMSPNWWNLKTKPWRLFHVSMSIYLSIFSIHPDHFNPQRSGEESTGLLKASLILHILSKGVKFPITPWETPVVELRRHRNSHPQRQIDPHQSRTTAT